VSDLTISQIIDSAITAAPWLAVLLFMWWQEHQARLKAEQQRDDLEKLHNDLLYELAFGSKVEALRTFPTSSVGTDGGSRASEARQ